jgi:hypothetical protein
MEEELALDGPPRPTTVRQDYEPRLGKAGRRRQYLGTLYDFLSSLGPKPAMTRGSDVTSSADEFISAYDRLMSGAGVWRF